MSQISVTVEQPSGLIAPEIFVQYQPKTTEEFDAIIAALGGPAAIKGVVDNIAQHGGFAYTDIDGASIHVQLPTDLAPPPPPPVSLSREFSAALREQIADAKRGAVAA